MKNHDEINVCNYLKMFIVLLVIIVNASTHTKGVSLSSQKCEIQPFLIISEQR